MLRPACQLYRSRFEPDLPDGRNDAHARRCPECRHYAELIGRLRHYGDHEPLPIRLRLRLERVLAGRPALGQPPSALPLPSGLRDRLRLLAESRPLPASLLRAGYGVAASYLLVMSMALNLGNPYRVGRGLTVEVADLLSTGAEQMWVGVESLGAEVATSARTTSDQLNRRTKQRLRTESEAIVAYGERLWSRLRRIQQELTSAAAFANPSEESSDGRREPESDPSNR